MPQHAEREATNAAGPVLPQRQRVVSNLEPREHLRHGVMTTNQEDLEASQVTSAGGITPSVPNDRRPLWGSKRGCLLLGGVIGLCVGAIVGRLFPPFVLDDEFWRAFFTSAGFGGVLALVAAGVAFGAAAYSSHRTAKNVAEDREQRERAANNDRTQRERAADEDRRQREAADQRSQWWDRFTWATERALDEKTRDAGVASMIGLVGHPWAGPEDTDIAITVADVLDSRDTEDDGSNKQNGGVQ